MTAQVSLFDAWGTPAPRVERTPLVSVPRGPSLRPYQVAADSAVDAAWSAGKRRVLVVQATGTGKTVLFAEQARKHHGALVLAHRDSLIRQAAAKLRAATGCEVGIEKAEERAYGSRYTCASVQTLKGPRLERFARDRRDIEFVVVDECHRAVAKSYRAIFEAFPNALVLGVTATADRSDKVGLWNVFEKVGDEHGGAAYRYEIREAIDDAWLVPAESIPINCKLNLDKIDLRNGDLDKAQLDDALVEFASDIARSAMDHLEDWRTIIFTPGVKTAQVGAEALNKLRPGCARVVWGEQDDQEKDRTCREHKDGAFQFLLNCGVLTEGYDDPRLLCVFDCAKTKSRLRHAQKFGRGTRPWEDSGRTVVDGLDAVEERRAAIKASPKPLFRYRDLACLGDRHSLAGPLDLLAGKETEEVRARAAKILKDRGGEIDSVIAEARSELEEEKARAAAAAKRAAQKRAELGRARTAAELFGLRDFHDDPFDNGEAATLGDIERLAQMKITPPPGCTHAQASKLLNAAWARRRAGLASFPQLKYLRNLGYTGPTNITIKQACGLIDQLKERRA